MDQAGAANPTQQTRAISDPALFVAPTRYRTGPGATAEVGSEAARLSDRPLIVHGPAGWPRVAAAVDKALAMEGLAVETTEHRGYVTAEAVEAIREAARTSSAGAIVAVGGGRVLDAGKSAADALSIPCVLVPTSPATCSGATAVVVDYDARGGYLGSRRTARPPAASVVDTAVLAGAPDRLLVAGLVDALAKSVEVLAHAASEEGATGLAAHVLARDMATMIFRDAEAAVASGPQDPLRQRAAEIAVLWPGLVGGLASEAAKLAAAHPVHNALTHEQRDPAVPRALHGEVLAYGVLVQLLLQGEAEEAGRCAILFARLRCPADLRALGFGGLAEDPVAFERAAARAAAAGPLRAAFPGATPGDVAAAMRAADDVAAEAARGV